MQAFYYTRFNSENNIIEQGTLSDKDADSASEKMNGIRVYSGERLIGTMVSPDGKSVTFYDQGVNVVYAFQGQ